MNSIALIIAVGGGVACFLLILAVYLDSDWFYKP